MAGELDIEKREDLIGYLRSAGHIGGAEAPRIRVLVGGVSNRTVLVERDSGEAWVVKQALAKLRVDDDWFSDPARIEREAAGMRALERIAPPGSITPLLHLDAGRHLLIMRAVAQPHENWKSLLLAGRIEHAHFEQFAALLAAIHRESASPSFRDEFGDRTFFESLRIEPYYLAAAERFPSAAAFLHALVQETRARRVCLVHGDYSPKNVLLQNGRVILLDHEVIHFGDPAFDIGFSMAHFLSKARHTQQRGGALGSEALFYWERYAESGGLAGEEESVRHTLACMLARVAGRSRLEYLSGAEQKSQQIDVVRLLKRPPQSFAALAEDILPRQGEQ